MKAFLCGCASECLWVKMWVNVGDNNEAPLSTSLPHIPIHIGESNSVAAQLEMALCWYILLQLCSSCRVLSDTQRLSSMAPSSPHLLPTHPLPALHSEVSPAEENRNSVCPIRCSSKHMRLCICCLLPRPLFAARCSLVRFPNQLAFQVRQGPCLSV